MSETPNGSVREVGLVLAGGQGSRMGVEDKPLVTLAGRPMLDRAIERLRPQVGPIVLSANGDPARFAAYGLPVVADIVEGFAGPLAGLHSGMRWAQENRPEARFIVSIASDTPFFPATLVQRLAACGAMAEDTVALAASPAGTHPVFGRWPIALVDDLEEFLKSKESGKILAFVDRHIRLNVPFDEIELPDGETVDPFFNVNTPEDVAKAEAIAAALEERVA
jgi:molybdopterin-guanine dinucleotide biosynthesis protein A